MNRSCNLVLSVVFCIAMLAMGQTAEQPGKSERHSSGSFQLKISKGLLSLKADDAALVQIFAEIAKQASIIIESHIAPEEKITIRLDKVPLEDGIKQLAKNVTVFYAQDDKARRIERVLVLSERSDSSGQSKTQVQPEKAKQPAPPAAEAKSPLPQPEPFKFEFDPAKFAKEKAGKQP